MKKIIICFDVDNTLVKDDKPNNNVIFLFKWFQENGHTMHIWSGGGDWYAQMWGDRLGLAPFKAIEKGSITPDIAVDDQEVTLGKINVQV